MGGGRGLIESIGVATDQWFGSAADPGSPVASAAMVTGFAPGGYYRNLR